MATIKSDQDPEDRKDLYIYFLGVNFGNCFEFTLCDENKRSNLGGWGGVGGHKITECVPSRLPAAVQTSYDLSSGMLSSIDWYRGADKSLARPWKETSYSDQDLQHYTKTYFSNTPTNAHI